MTAGAPAIEIAYYLLAQALAADHSMPIEVSPVKEDGTDLSPEEIEAIDDLHWITYSSPVNQAQTLAAILTQLQELGYPVGIDYYSFWSRDDAKNPVAHIGLAYPRAGITEPADVPIIELSEALELSYSEDGTSQSNVVIARAGASEGKDEKAEERQEPWDEAFDEGYPLLEQAGTMPALAPSDDPGAMLTAFLHGLLAVSAYPLLAPVVTLPMFGAAEGGAGGLSIFDLTVGDDVVLRIPRAIGELPSNNPRFPNGLPETNAQVFFRITRIDCEVPDDGVPVMKLTLNLPPKGEKNKQIPVVPPGGGAS
jgi:hypothetical protein